jgi:asparagine synthase (glutamine-hydrolysing)
MYNFKHIIPKYITGGGRIKNMINEYLTKAVQKRLMSERPMCCMLSGGLDSSLITSILCKLIGPENVSTYSIGIEGSEDLRYARIVAEHLGTKHTEVTFTPEEGFAAIPDVIKDLESFDITTIRASVGMWLLAKYISKNTDDIVVLSGEGADELLMGYLYFHYSPTIYEAKNESLRLINELYIYDVLRVDRCISSHGLEPRVPFLDRDFVNLCITISSEIKVPKNGIEKYLLRKAFEIDYLPHEVLWRRKDGWSDSISGSSGKKWYEQIQEFIEPIISDEEFETVSTNFISKEAYYYKKIFNETFPPSFRPDYKYWLPKWVDHGGDPSGRKLQIFKDKIEK